MSYNTCPKTIELIDTYPHESELPQSSQPYFIENTDLLLALKRRQITEEESNPPQMVHEKPTQKTDPYFAGAQDATHLYFCPQTQDGIRNRLLYIFGFIKQFMPRTPRLSNGRSIEHAFALVALKSDKPSPTRQETPNKEVVNKYSFNGDK
jgi:hypothetical protein